MTAIFGMSLLTRKIRHLNYISLVSKRNVIMKPILKKPNEKYKEVMLVIPIATFGLGVWQVYRWRWKLSLIERLESKMSADPIELPEDLSKVSEGDLEYQRVKVKGHFDHSSELYLAPRSLVVQGVDPGQGQGLISAGQRSNIGVWVVSPFVLSDRKDDQGNNIRILVNRGWVPREHADPKKRLEAQNKDEVEIVGVVRKTEKRPPFGQKNNQNSSSWQHRDLDAMSSKLNTFPIFIDADVTSTVPGGPIGGQTRVTLRNEHLSYVATWFGLSGFTSYMWYMKYVKRFALLV